jgi:hypothetical protein
MRLDELPESTRQAYECIRQATTFALGPAGVAGTLLPEKKCCDQLIGDPRGIELFQLLLDEGTPAAKAFALYGLYTIDRPVYTSVVERYRHDPTSVLQLLGCIGGKVPLSRIVHEIEGEPVTG